MSDDPFACFDESDDEHDGVGASPDNVAPTRDPECGVMSFHRGTEQSLLIFVRNHAAATTPEAVMKAVDDFCLQRHWMMHVGPAKSLQLTTFLHECVASRGSGRRFVLLELGTYCGYSSILWADTLQKLGIDFHVYTVEANPEFIEVARGLIELSGLGSSISVLHLDVLGKNQKLPDLLKANNVSTLDFVFFDHDKDAYLDDLQELEKAKLVHSGVHVVADNVLFACIDNYRCYIQDLTERGIVQSRLEKGSLEYSEVEQKAASDPSLYEDGIGKYCKCMHEFSTSNSSREHRCCFHFIAAEFTIYVKDPGPS
jgi:catechol O-methyltransferase